MQVLSGIGSQCIAESKIYHAYLDWGTIEIKLEYKQS
jgi:hypothetical protein